MTHHIQARYALDANILINAYWDYYPIDVFPGFWDFLSYNITVGRILIIDRVRAEIKSPPQLVQWIDQVANSIFVPTVIQPAIADTYGRMADWVQENPQYLPAAGDKFTRDADGWLVAYASVSGSVVVTNEVFDPNVRIRVPIPNLCDEFDVECKKALDMLRDLDAHFNWRQSL